MSNARVVNLIAKMNEKESAQVEGEEIDGVTRFPVIGGSEED